MIQKRRKKDTRTCDVLRPAISKRGLFRTVVGKLLCERDGVMLEIQVICKTWDKICRHWSRRLAGGCGRGDLG